MRVSLLSSYLMLEYNEPRASLHQLSFLKRKGTLETYTDVQRMYFSPDSQSSPSKPG